MSVYSMTGYASASAGAARQGDGGAASTAGAGPLVSAELRSVNGRFLDLSLRLPDELRALEPALREMVAGAVKRGFDMVMLTSDLSCMIAGARAQLDELKAKTK